MEVGWKGAVLVVIVVECRAALGYDRRTGGKGIVVEVNIKLDIFFTSL